VVTRVERFFTAVDSAVASDSLADLLDRRSIQITGAQRDLLSDPTVSGMIRRTAVRAAREILPRGVADGAQLREYETRTITVREGDTERSMARDAVLTPTEFFESAVQLLPESAPPDVQETLRVILIQFVEYSLELNVQATENDRDVASRAVPETAGRVLRDQVIVRAGDPITEDDRRELQAYEVRLRDAGLLEDGQVDPWPFVGSGILNTLVLAVFCLLLFFFRREVYDNPRWVGLIAVLVVAFFGLAALVARYNVGAYELLPIAFVALAVAVLWDGRMALVLVMVLAVAVGAQQPFAPRAVEVVVMTILGGGAAALAVRAVRRRAQAWVFGALVAGAYAVTILAFQLMGVQTNGELGPSLAYAGGNAFLSALLAMGFLPVFEWLTGITTDQTLLEWADPNRSLLKRLSMEAPGTYAHTINVANLAEAAANAIGANGLLCRVGLYYHDVGKVLKPHYFVENQPEGRNPHDRLKPDTSATIVKEHVTEGLRMAREAGVPDVVAAFIPEHHGDQRISFFWERAKEELGGEDQLEPGDFRYPGPRPRSKETAIAMLADSVESATRALQDPTAERVRSLIDSIVDAKIVDHQLDDAPLTLGEIGMIKDQFSKVLSGIYHHRIDYPQTKHLTDAPGKGESDPNGGSVDEEGPGEAGSEKPSGPNA
jgi:putative nucleotidyltransferase with HDIG domain